MKQSLAKLVEVIVEKLAERPEWRASDPGIRSWLLRQGYSKRDIDAALKMVGPGGQRPLPLRAGPGQVRHLSEYEAYRLSPEARSALLRLELYELIDPFEREMLLERIDQFEGEVTLTDIEYLVNWLICPSRDVENQKTILQALSGVGYTKH